MNDEILYRYFNGELSEKETGLILEWLESDPSHQQEFDAAHTLFNASVINDMRRRNMEFIPSRRNSRIRRVFRSVSRIAAAIVLIAGAAYAGKIMEENATYRKLSSQMNVMEVPAGQRMAMTLQDGTVVHLNGGSRLEYPMMFSKDVREVRLSGEAYLEVSHDEKHPFVVKTFASEIEVLGTEFNVYADETENRFSTTLINGKVKVSTIGEYVEQVILGPDEKVRYIDNHLVVSAVNAEDAISWTEGYINLRDVGFQELMDRFENAYGVKIIVDREDMPEVGYVSGKIRVSEGIDFALHLLQEECDFSYEKNMKDNCIIIR